jgi:hypothetical protein
MAKIIGNRCKRFRSFPSLWLDQVAIEERHRLGRQLSPSLRRLKSVEVIYFGEGRWHASGL